MNRPAIISLGEVLWDLFPDSERFGGAPSNFACHAAILGADVSMVSAVGDVSRTTIRRAVKAAGVAGIARVLDINLRPPFFDSELIRESVQQASILKLSDEELPQVCAASGVRSNATPETQLRQLLETEDLDLVVMTRGAKGALLATPEGILNQSGIETDVRDTVGDGDSFTAAFLLGLLRGEPHNQILHRACATAAAACSHSGAVPNSPPSPSAVKPTSAQR